MTWNNLATVILAGMGLLAAPGAFAQTATPTQSPLATPTCTPRAEPAACAGAKKLYVTWKAKDPQTLRVAISATGCPTVSSCALQAPGELVSDPPVSVSITDASNQMFAETLVATGINTSGCPGSDIYRGVDRLRLVFGASTTVIGKLRIQQAQTVPPDLTPPIRVEVRDACGPLYSAVLNTCYPRAKNGITSTKCN